MSQLANVLKEFFPEKLSRSYWHWQLIDSRLETIGLYLLKFPNSFEAQEFGKAIMKARLKDRYWVQYVTRPQIFHTTNETGVTDYYLYESKRTDLAFNNDGFTVFPSHLLYPKIMETGEPVIPRIWKERLDAEINLDRKVNPDKSISIWLREGAKIILTDYRYLANMILPELMPYTH